MGSDLYVSVEVRQTDKNWKSWSAVFEGASMALARGIVVDAFGGAGEVSDGILKRYGYLTHDEIKKSQEHEECPWRLDEPYWVRELPGQTFFDIVREKRWQHLQYGDFHDTECSPELSAIAAMVGALIASSREVRVWCWHSQ